MLKQFSRFLSGSVVAIASLSPAMAQSHDPLTRFLDGIFRSPLASQGAPAEQQAAPAAEPAPQEQVPAQKPAPARPKVAQPQKAEQKKVAAPKATPAAGKPVADAAKDAATPAVKPQPAPPVRQEASAVPEPVAPATQAPAKAAEPPKPERQTPQQNASAAAATPVAAAAATPKVPPLPASPEAALSQVNGYFNAIDQLTAYFVQKNPNGQQVDGTLAVRRPGILQFVYAPPSTLEIVSDGRNVAIRDKKLGTNDVYPIGQTPLKFLLQEDVDLAKDSKLRDVQVGRDGIITVRFDDSTTLGGTSRITLRFDARANALRQWTILDGQGYETSVSLSNVNVVRRKDASASN
jgi:outer membrane lipoprotein-sorting protein